MVKSKSAMGKSWWRCCRLTSCMQCEFVDRCVYRICIECRKCGEEGLGGNARVSGKQFNVGTSIVNGCKILSRPVPG